MRQEETNFLHIVYHSGSVDQHNIYYVVSTDGGGSWSRKLELGQGKHPAIALDWQGYPQVIWLSDDEQDLLYAYCANSVWYGPYTIFSVTGTQKLGPPAFCAVPGMIGSQGHVVFHWRNGINPPTTILYGWLPLNTSGTLQDVVPIDGSSDQECLRPSIALHLGEYMGYYGFSLHAAWTKGDQVFYASKILEQGQGWTFPGQISEIQGSCDPNIEAYGDHVHVVWIEPAPPQSQVTHRSRFLPDGLWDFPQMVTQAQDCASAQMASGYYCFWSQNDNGNNEIYYSWWLWGGWEPAINLSNTVQRSKSPQVTFAPFMMGTFLYCFWTEDDEPPYQEYFVQTLGPLSPFFYQDLGQEQAGYYTTHRGGYIQYAQHPEQTADTSRTCLSYRFGHLNPKKIYLMKASYYHEGNKPTNFEIQIDGTSLKNIVIPANSIIRDEYKLPSQFYADSVVVLTIQSTGKLGTISTIALCQAEPETKGGPQDAFTSPFNARIPYLKIFPNPAHEVLNLEYNLPNSMAIDLSVYDVSGRLIKSLVSSKQEAGLYHKVLNNRDLSQGVYFIRLDTEKESIVQKVIFLR